jgi:hypothetical protein
MLEEYLDSGYGPGYIDINTNPVLFYPYRNFYDKLSLNSTILLVKNGITHYYYITNIIKNNNGEIVCELQEIPPSSGFLQNVSFVYSKYSKSLLIKLNNEPNGLYLVKDLIDNINRDI